ncbi:MAG TPA: hypothetical protein VK066_17745 [Chloroflexota bacterium]|nr:hypothetical protein [Chloroflexota bacterium]
MARAVVVLSDDDMSLAMIHLNLARRGYSVLLALLEHVAQGWSPPASPDLLIVDLAAPEPRCWEITAWVRALPWASRVRLLVLNPCWPDAAWLARLAAHRHLRKPFAVDHLMAAVEDALAAAP